MMPDKGKICVHHTILTINSPFIVVIVRKLKPGVQYYTAVICVPKYRVVVLVPGNPIEC